MNPNFLDFEQPIADLEAKIAELGRASTGQSVNIDAEVEGLREKLRQRTAEIFHALTPWQISQLARHPQRPYTLDYLGLICDEFHELAGDRAFADDAAIVGGLARIGGRSCVVIGQQKGRDTKSKIRRNFGMPRPEGYRKALRLMKLAERFALPLFTFIDTPGAYPGVGAEERGQSEAIARNLLEMAELRIPVVCTVIGEGGSGGALAIGVGDRTLMLQYSTYSVISPEGCASILWKSADKARDAAEALGLTANRLLEHKLIDRIVPEPLGGAHRDPVTMAATLKQALLDELARLERVDVDTLLEQRYARLRSYGAYEKRVAMAAALAAALARAPETPLLVAFSGGLDSTVLLHALSASPALRARGLRALHVRHDLNAAAADWAEHCAQFCGSVGVGLEIAPVRVPRDSGLGLEGAARKVRHAAFAAALAPGETLVLAHHRGDQAETVLLRLLRASGSEGLAAMRESRDFAAGRLWRPLLEVPRAELREYAQANRLAWLEDPSNADTRFERNYLRHELLPRMQARWPGAEAALARSAALLAEDAALLDEVARGHLRTAATGDPRTLATAPLLALSPGWRARVLRAWLAALGLPPLPGRAHALVDAELLRSRHDAQPSYRWEGLRLERWRGLLHVEADRPVSPAAFSCAWNGQARLQLPDGASLELQRADAAAGDADLPAGLAPLRVSLRQGGERIRLPGRRHSHALKDCLLQAGLPPWLRRRVPLLHAPDEELLAAGDAVLSDRWQRACAPHGLRLRWRPSPARD